jgi:hypothetical protein
MEANERAEQREKAERNIISVTAITQNCNGIPGRAYLIRQGRCCTMTKDLGYAERIAEALKKQVANDMYYNTNNLTGKQLADGKKKAARQEDIILDLFRLQPTRMILPDEVWREVGSHRGWPLTSVRRALTNLTDQGELEKTNKLGGGGYGKPVHYWRLKVKAREQIQLKMWRDI